MTGEPRPRARRSRWRRLLALLAAFVLLVIVFHPLLLGLALREGLRHVIGMAWWKITIGEVQVAAGHPVVLTDMHIYADDPKRSGTDVHVQRLQVDFSNLWSVWKGKRRLIGLAEIQGIQGSFDLRPTALPPPPHIPDLTTEELRLQAETILKFLPHEVRLREADLTFLGIDQSYRLMNASADFREDQPGTLTAEWVEVNAGGIHTRIGPLHAVTQWGRGTASLSDFTLRRDMKVNLFEARFTQLEGITLTLDGNAFGGTLNGQITFIGYRGLPGVDTTVTARNVSLAPLCELMNLAPAATGTLAEGGYTFRGIPERPFEARSSTRLLLKDLVWQGRTCDMLEAAASYENEVLRVKRFSIARQQSSLEGEGELTTTGGHFDAEKGDFLVNLRGRAEGGDLAEWLGLPREDAAGWVSVLAAASRKGGVLDGSASIETGEASFRGLTVDRTRAEAVFCEGKATITSVEIESGTDTIRGSGEVALQKPFAYSGTLRADLGEISPFLSLIPGSEASGIYSGGLTAQWGGSGSETGHSGTFDITLRDLFTEKTASGLNGRFAGSYSPTALNLTSCELSSGPLQLTTALSCTPEGLTVSGLKLVSGATPLAGGDMYLPVDYSVIVARKPLGEALIAGREVAAGVATAGALSLSDLGRLFGQALPTEGTVALNLKASGLPSALVVDGSLQGRDLAVHMEDHTSPRANFDATLRAANGKASLAGTLATAGFPSLTISAQAPFGFVRGADGKLVWANPDGTIAGNVSVPRTDVGALQPFFPQMRRLTGTLTGGLNLSGTLAKPKVEGVIALAGGSFQISTRAPIIGNLNGSMRFDSDSVAVERFTGDMAAGPFQVTGGVTFSDPKNLKYDIAFTGRKILLARDAGLRLRANLDIRARGDNSGGSVTGAVKLVDGRVYRKLEITPLLVPSPVNGPLWVPPVLAGLAPPPFAGWAVDIGISNETPFKIVGNIASGEIIPDLRIVGTLGNPVPSGRVTLKDTRAYLPFSTMQIPQGEITFTPANPWVPMLDIHATAQALDYTVQAYAYGPLDEKHLILRSEPPLPQESIVLLLTTGFAPGAYAGAGFGEAAAGQGGLLVLRTLLRQIDAKGFDVESLVNRLQISAVPPVDPYDRAGIRGRFEIWRGISVMSERDSYGYYNAGVTYQLRFR